MYGEAFVVRLLFISAFLTITHSFLKVTNRVALLTSSVFSIIFFGTEIIAFFHSHFCNFLILTLSEAF